MARDEDESGEDESSEKPDFYAFYEAKEVLGKGMSSTVRRCVEKATGREYAVKILDITTERSSEEQANELRDSTLSEIRILRKHKARGGELFDYLTTRVTVSEKKIRHIMRQVLEAVLEMHSRRIVHRDMKPENILLVDNEVVKVTDFGFAYELAVGESLRELVGTPGYLAPEVLKVNMFEETEGYSLEVDMWACGVIMYTMFCGYAPFYHRKQLYMLRAIAEGKYEFRSPEWDEISDISKDLIRKLLCVNQKERYTAKQALAHSFFQQVSPEGFIPVAKKFNARKRFKLCIIRVRLLVRLLRIKCTPTLVPARQVHNNPYGARKLRKQIDNLAFTVYGHWVKKVKRQQVADWQYVRVHRYRKQYLRHPVLATGKQSICSVPIICSIPSLGNHIYANINKQLLLNIEERSKDADACINERKWEELIANFYTPQSKILTPDGRTIVGKEDVSTWYKETVQDKPYQITTRVEEVNGDGDWAYSRGTYKLSVEGSEKEAGK